MNDFQIIIWKSISGKCHRILSFNNENKEMELNGEVINKTQVQKIIAVLMDYILKFHTYTKTLCKKVGKKLHADIKSRVIKSHKES